MSSMSTFAHSSSSSCSHSTPLTLTSSSLTNYSPKTNLTVHVADQPTLCPDSTKRGLLPLWPPQVMRPTWLTLLTSSRLFLTLFQSSNIETVRNLGDNDASSPNAENDDEHIRNAPALPLFSQDCEAEANLRHTDHSNEWGLFQGAQLIWASTGRPVVWPTQERKSRPRHGWWKNQDHFGNAKGATARGSKIRNPEKRVQSGSCRK